MPPLVGAIRAGAVFSGRTPPLSEDCLKTVRMWLWFVWGVMGVAFVLQPQALAQLKVAQLPIRTDGPKSLDPVKGSTVYDNQATCQIYDCLLQNKYLKRPELEPCLVAEMPRVTNG